MMYHVNDEGNVLRCVAKADNCKFTIHNEDPAVATREFEHEQGHVHLQSHTVAQGKRAAKTELVDEFTADNYYGAVEPRKIQLHALNDVAQALSENEATQLVAACGTGKTYMHRQLLNHEMLQPGATGVGIILTSSIRLAHDTASDLRPPKDPNSAHDKAFGTLGEDYEVIEVHSDARPYSMPDGKVRPSVREAGTISVERIYEQLKSATDAGKKVIIVSTYDSVAKVQEAQARFEDEARVKADLLIHDEAHNILGQQRPPASAVASDENELTAYVGFDNAIPGSVQASKRLYSTATPVLRENEDEDQPTATIEDAIVKAKLMQNKEQRERITFYSDHPAIGEVSGFISQEEAITNKYLAEPIYEIRKSALGGAVANFKDPVVNPDGTLIEREAATVKHPLTPATFGALNATIDALVADPIKDDENTAHNALAYVGAIDQAEGFKAAFREVALHKAGGMTLATAAMHVDSDDPALKAKARYRLLAEHAAVKAAHSRTDSAAVKERKEAFEMFHGNAATSNEWTPHKKVLANVDIFSEGVSISEIDTVIMSDDSKLNEKSMTQAIGRSIRVINGNHHKKYGRVIIPSVVDSSGHDVTEASVNMATYTATRVERSTAATKLRGETVKPDTKTNFTVYGLNGETETKAARSIAQNAVTDLNDLAVAYELSSYSTPDESYKNASPAERFQIRKSNIDTRLARLKKDSPQRRYLMGIKESMAGKTEAELRSLERSGRVLSSALANGDVSSIHPDVAATLIKHGVLTTNSKPQEITLDEKREFLQSYKSEMAFTLLTKTDKSTEAHLAARDRLEGTLDLDRRKLMKEGMYLVTKGAAETATTRAMTAKYEELLSDPSFVENAFATFNTDEKNLPPSVNNWKTKNSLRQDIANLHEALLKRKHSSASAGEEEYYVNREKVKRTGELRKTALASILS